MTNYFEYNNGCDLPEGTFRISPSQLSKFFDNTSLWYRENFLNEKDYLQTTSMALGTVVHATAAMYFDSKQVDTHAIDSYISSITIPDVDRSIISDCYKPMATTLINNFLAKTKATHSEWFISHTIRPGIVLAGSADLVDTTNGILYDYKTISSLDSARIPTSFPRAYYFQQLAYAYILRKLGHHIEYCKLVYVSRPNVGRISEKTGKPMKDYPSECHIITHQITDEDMSIIENTINLIADSIDLCRTDPSKLYLLAQDYRLKLKPKPTLFKD